MSETPIHKTLLIKRGSFTESFSGISETTKRQLPDTLDPLVFGIPDHSDDIGIKNIRQTAEDPERAADNYEITTA